MIEIGKIEKLEEIMNLNTISVSNAGMHPLYKKLFKKQYEILCLKNQARYCEDDWDWQGKILAEEKMKKAIRERNKIFRKWQKYCFSCAEDAVLVGSF